MTTAAPSFHESNIAAARSMRGPVHVDDGETRDLWHASSARPEGWRPAAPAVSGVNAQWIRGAVLRGEGGGARYGFVYDAGSDRGSGMNWYGELPLTPAP